MLDELRWLGDPLSTRLVQHNLYYKPWFDLHDFRRRKSEVIFTEVPANVDDLDSIFDFTEVLWALLKNFHNSEW